MLSLSLLLGVFLLLVPMALALGAGGVGWPGPARRLSRGWIAWLGAAGLSGGVSGGGVQAGPASPGVPPWARLSVLDNGKVRVGVDLNHGGALVFLSREGGENRINNFDFGRQVQLAFYGGPVPFLFAGQTPAAHWAHLGWNPVQTGDDFRNASRVLAHENDGRRLYVRCQPLQWPLNAIAADCTFELWLELDGVAVQARARLQNARTDRSWYPARLQELPAAYANASFYRVLSYTGARPFTGAAPSLMEKSTTAHPWTHWFGTEGWSALLDDQDSGLGLLTPGRIWFTGGFAGQPDRSKTSSPAPAPSSASASASASRAPEAPEADATAVSVLPSGGPGREGRAGSADRATLATDAGYLAGQALEILDHNLNYEYRFELVPGFLKEIRERAALHQRPGLPHWRFESDRQGWSYQRVRDAGWPVQGELDLRLEENDPQLHAPPTFWKAEEAPMLEMEIAVDSRQRQSTVFWKPLHPGSGSEGHCSFPIEPDGLFHKVRVRLADSPAYRGAMGGLRWDPVSEGQGDRVRVRSIRLISDIP